MDNSDNNSPSFISREKLEEVATWVGTTVVSAFFSSLERFACVNLAIADPDDDDDDEEEYYDPEEANDPPITYS